MVANSSNGAQKKAFQFQAPRRNNGQINGIAWIPCKQHLRIFFFRFATRRSNGCLLQSIAAETLLNPYGW